MGTEPLGEVNQAVICLVFQTKVEVMVGGGMQANTYSDKWDGDSASNDLVDINLPQLRDPWFLNKVHPWMKTPDFLCLGEFKPSLLIADEGAVLRKAFYQFCIILIRNKN